MRNIRYKRFRSLYESHAKYHSLLKPKSSKLVKMSLRTLEKYQLLSIMLSLKVPESIITKMYLKTCVLYENVVPNLAVTIFTLFCDL